MKIVSIIAMLSKTYKAMIFDLPWLIIIPVLNSSIYFEMSKRPNKRAYRNQQREENEIKLVKSLADEEDVNIH